MLMRTELGIDVAAPARSVFDLVRDVSRWPELLPHYRYVTVRSLRNGGQMADMSARRMVGRIGIPVAWRSEFRADGTDGNELRLHFLHRAGVTKGMQVTWRIRPRSDGSRVTIEHDFERRLPLLGPDALPRIVDRFFVRPIAGRTLAAFKRLAEERVG
jgi:ribosome-associated toxin RatA of RatAB toxin-antitoxin module